MGNCCKPSIPNITVKTKSRCPCGSVSQCCDDNETKFYCCVAIHNQKEKDTSNTSNTSLSNINA